MVSTQYLRQQKIGINKILASTKHWHQQNISVDKILALTKDWRWQNIGTCMEAYPYCFGLAKSAAADFSQTLLMFSCTSPWRCCTLHVQSQSVLLPLAATLCLHLSPTMYRPICTCPPCRKSWRKVYRSFSAWKQAENTVYTFFFLNSLQQLCRSRNFELCSICLWEDLGRSKPATNPWNKHK